MIAIIDYGVGNLFSLKSSLAYLGLEAVVTADPAVIQAADRIILPGVGAFADAKAKLEVTGLIPLIKAEAESGKPLLGICLGMQMLFDKSLEYGEHEGIGLIHGIVSPITDDLRTSLKVPHMGWNALHFPNAELKESSPVFRDIDEGEFVYFVHSYYASECDADVVAVCDCGVPITAAVVRGNVMGCQFHPEKSSRAGLKILKNFCEGDFGGAR
jgi:glutamine amidotransferase